MMTHDPTTSNMAKKINPKNGKCGPSIPIQGNSVEDILMFRRFYELLYKQTNKTQNSTMMVD